MADVAVQAPAVRRVPALPGRAVLGTLAIGAIAGVSAAVALAAAARPSILSGPARRGGAPGWLLGPLTGHLGSLPSDRLALEADFTRALALLGVAWLVALVCARRVPLAAVWVAAVAAQVVLLLGPPLSLTDVFNYIHYGRMADHGLNPYVALPLTFRHDPSYRYSNWHHLPSPYGPLFTLLSQGLGLLSVPVAYWVWKVILAAASIGTLALVAGTARALGRSRRMALVLVGLNPLVLVYGIGGAHQEPLMLLGAVGAVALALRGRDATAGAAVLLAAGFKPSAVLLAPVVVLGCRRRGRALAGAVGGAALVGAVVLLAYGGHGPATGIQDRLVTPFSVPNVLAALAGQGGLTAHDRTLADAVLALAALGAAGAVAWRREWLPAAAGAVMLAGVLTLGWTMPWYVWWILPFAALARTRALAAACAVLSAWLALGAISQSPKLLHAAGYFPTRGPVGRANHLYVERHLK